MLFDVERLGVKRTLAATAYLVVDERRRFGYIQCAPDTYRRAVQVSRADFRHVTRTVHLLVFLSVLIVVVGLQRQLRAADYALEAPAMKERKILERAHSVHLVHRLVAPQACAFVKV